jgi:prepilin-type N-terminal cleavage/methylation domain-containing protein/prepilin-type processing-associated H-X9-DG protein
MLCAAPRARKTGFTLIELLVVVAIIALLLSLLMGSLRAARAQARQVRCATQLREYARGFHYYLQDNNDTFPATDYGPVSGTGVKRPTWFELIDRYWLKASQTGTASDGDAGRKMGLARCPDLPAGKFGDAFRTWDYDWRMFGYGYNKFFLGFNRFDIRLPVPNTAVQPVFWRKLRDVRNSSECLMLADSPLRDLINYSGVDPAGHYVSWRGLSEDRTGVDTRHAATQETSTVASKYKKGTSYYLDGRGNIAWVDGHVDTRRASEINFVVEHRRFWDPRQGVGGY